MSTNKLTIVLAKLELIPIKSATLRSSHDTAAPSCIIKTAETEIFFVSPNSNHAYFYATSLGTIKRGVFL